MVNLYDEALLAKLNNWTENTDLHIYGPDETRRLFEVIADNTNDKPITLPIICLRRVGGFTILNINQRPLTYDGFAVDGNEEKVLQLNAIPISIRYQLDIYTRYMKEADAYCRNFVFNIINYPNLPIVIPYNDINFTHNSTIRIGADVEDNSSIPERLVAGQFTRMTLNLDIDDAYLWNTKFRKNLSIDTPIIDPGGGIITPVPPSEDGDWNEEQLSELEGLNVVVNDPDKKFVIEEVKL